MRTVQVNVTRDAALMVSDHRRVIPRFLELSDPDRERGVVERVLRLTEAEVADGLARVLEHFGGRHPALEASLLRHYERVAHYTAGREPLSHADRLLLGAHFTMEYAIEAAALFNPSIVLHPDQTGAPAGGARLVMSLRATGEQHISSIVFREGVLHADGRLSFERPGPHAFTGRPVRGRWHGRAAFFDRLAEQGHTGAAFERIRDRLDPEFSQEQLDAVVSAVLREPARHRAHTAARCVQLFAEAQHEVEFPDTVAVSDMVIFPTADREIQGMEDVRLTRFVGDDGRAIYYGTYTAYDGFNILPQMFETRDFRRFHMGTLSGRCVRNKGFAMFPRKVGGRYLMVSRLDGQSLYLMASDNPYRWEHAMMLQKPVAPWECVQIGNCGSPLETERGWLLLTHGVGAMRQYCIGAILLDRDDPGRVIGRTAEPILVPTEREREGYVPNVVYTCGAMIHRGQLIMPYAMSDLATGVARVSLDELLDYMTLQPVMA